MAGTSQRRVSALSLCLAVGLACALESTGQGRQERESPPATARAGAPEPGTARESRPKGQDQKADAKADGEGQDLASEESLARFEQLLAKRPFHGPAFEGLVKHYVDRARLDDLIGEYTAKSAALPDDAPLRIVLARLQLRKGDAPAASKLLDSIDRLPPELARSQSDLLALKAEVYQRNGDNAGAERVLKEAQKQAPSTSEKLRLGEALADLYLRDGRKGDAVAALTALAEEFPDNYLHQRHVAGALAQRGLHEAAVDRYKVVLDLAKGEVDRRCEVLRELGQSLERLNKRDEAIAAYIEAVGMLASDHWLQKDLQDRIVNLYRASNKLDELTAYCQGQIKKSPEQTAMRVLLADVQGAMGKPEEGKKTFEEAVALFPKDMALSQKRVEFLERLDDAAGAAGEYERIIGLYPAEGELYIAYGQSLAAGKQVEAARNQWRHVLQQHLDDAVLAVRLGSLFETYDLDEDAAEAYERAIAAKPSQPDAYAALSRLWLTKGDLDKAVAALDRMGQANPKDASVQAALAQSLRSLGKPAEALEAITKACELAPEQVKNQQMRADLLVQNGRLDEALAVRRGAIDRITNPLQQGEAIGTLVSMAASAQKLDELKKGEEARAQAKPGDTTALVILARIADNQRDFPAQRARLDEILKADPGNEMALAQLARLLDATGDINGAVDTYTRLIQRTPARARQYYEAMVDLKLRYGDHAGATESLEGMGAGDPTSAATQSAVADQLVRTGDPQRALKFYERALAIQPDRHETRLEYGKALVDAGRLEDALAAFRAVATQRSDTDRAIEAIGRMHDTAQQLGRLEDLLDEMQHQVETDPSNTLVARALAQLLIQELEYSRAIDMLDVAQRNNPRDGDLALVRAEVLRRLARFDEAADSYQRVLRLPQVDQDYVLGELGKTWFEAGQVSQAKRQWRQIQNKLYAGTLLKNNGLLDDAIAALEEGIRLKPDEFSLHRNLIAAYEQAGRVDDAMQAARRLLDLDPTNVANIERLAEAFLRLGDRAGAADIASRMFSAAVGPDKSQQGPGAGAASAGGYQTFTAAMYAASSAQRAVGYGYGYSGQQGRTNLERAVGFFVGNGLNGELDEVLTRQLAAQPGNALLKDTAANLFMSELNKPELALSILRELESTPFPVEHQAWLGQCSQRDWMRIRQFNLIAAHPDLRDGELARLGGRPPADLERDDLLELAIIKNAQGSTDEAAALLERAVKADGADTLALGVLVDLLVAGEKFAQAEPHARGLVALLGERRERMHADTVERVRRDFVRSLPLELQLRVTDELLSDIADKWTMGSGWTDYDVSNTEATGYLRARLTLATICAETQRMDEARAIWQDLAPGHGPDVDRWTMLGDTAQLHQQQDLAFEFYQHALEAARRLAGDPLLRQVYTSNSAMQTWYGEDGGVDKAFNSIVDAFSKKDRLVELYDFLRDSNQEGKARRLAEQYKLDDALRPVLEERVKEAGAGFRAAGNDKLKASPPYFAQVCKLAELDDRAGDWDAAQKVYEAYLTDFPDELGLLELLGEVAEARLKLDEAVAWEKKVIDCKSRLAKSARDWALRELELTPSRPKVLSGERADPWSWASRWSRSPWSYGYGSGGSDQLDRSPSWMRLARLHLASNNTIAAADAMQQAVADATNRRDDVVREVIALIQQRQLTAKMLPVLRTLAVYAPADERVQLAFCESLKAGGNKGVALEVADRMLRRGVSDLGVLAQVKRYVGELRPEQAAPETTVASIEAEVAADKTNLKARMRLAKAYYYDLQVDKARDVLVKLAEEAPHLEDIHDLLVDVYTLSGDTDRLIEALKVKIDRQTDERKRRGARWRLVDELLGAGRNDEALALVKDLGDPKDPDSYVRVGTLLHYFGRHEEATAALAQAKKSRSGGRYGGDEGDFSVAISLALRGDTPGAADKILAEIDEQSRQQTQTSAMFAMDQGNPQFAPVEKVFVLYPELAGEVGKRLEARRDAAPADPKAIKLLMGFYHSTGRPDKAEALLDEIAAKGGTDQSLVASLVDRAVRRREYAKAIELAQKFIAQAPKPQLPPGMPAQYAGYAVLQSPRTSMVCKLGDIYWDTGAKDKAFDTYKLILDDKIDETRLAYATVCLLRGRTEEARKLVDEALAGQSLKPAKLLQFSALLYAVDGNTEKAFGALVEAAAPGQEDANPFEGGGGSPVQTLSSIARHANLVDPFAAFVKGRIEKNPNDWEAYDALSDAYWFAGRPVESLEVLDKAAAIAPLSAQALGSKVQRRAPVAPASELIPLYEKLIELSEANVQGDSSGRRGYYAQDSESPSQSYRDTLGGYLWEQGKHEEAKKVWSERLNAQRAQTYLRLGRLYEAQYAYDDAEKAYDRAVELEPENASANTASAAAAYRRGDLRKTLRCMLEVYLSGSRGEDDESRYARYYAQYSGAADDGSGRGAGRMNDWATALAADPELTSYLEEPAMAGRADQAKIMLASLTGDWSGLEGLLRPQIDARTVDPLTWQLWAKVQQRKGDWKEAARALDFLRRSKLTSIADHRDQLKLVLAGKQLREAAAGTRQAQPGAAQPGMPGGGSSRYYSRYSSSYGGYGYGSDSGDASLLPSIYMKLGDFQRAERLYLLSSSGGEVRSAFPALASLMWERDAKDRALELMRFGILFSGGEVPRYAGMLAESGKLEPAVDLLVRAYCWNSEEAQQSRYRVMYGGGAQQDFEQGGEYQVADTLWGIMKRAGSFDRTLAALAESSRKEPANLRLAKLVLSLQKRGERWGELRDGLAARRASGPPDGAMLAEEFHADCQLARWDDALALLPDMRALAPKETDRWARHEAFLEFMKNDAPGAIATLEPVLKKTVAGPNTPPAAETSALLAARRYGELSARLEERRRAGELAPGETETLVRALAAQDKWDRALAIALEESWNQNDVMNPAGRWWRVLATLSQGAALKSTPLAPRRPVDAALLTLVTKGPEPAAKLFAPLVASEDSALEAMRGLVLCATLAGDDGAALDANTKLNAWLEARRSTAWRTKPVPGLDRVARQGLEQMGEAGTSQSVAYSAYGMQSVGFERLSGSGPIVTYQALWAAHQGLQRTLLARAGKAGELAALVRAQVHTLTDVYAEADGEEDPMAVNAQYGQYAYAYSRRRSYGSQGDVSGDWAGSLRRTLWAAGRLDLLAAEYKKLPTPPAGELPWYEESLAATGDLDGAAAARRQRARTLLADLRSSDTPDLGASGRSQWWYWQSDDSTSPAIQGIRAALWASSANEPDDPDRSSAAPNPSTLSGLALADPAIEKDLVACDADVGPGWLSTRTLQELVALRRARNQPEKVIELVERAGGTDTDQLLRSPRLEAYVWALWKTKSFDKIAALLTAAEKFGDDVQRDALLTRIALARARGQADQAAALESDYLRRSAAPKLNPAPVAREFVDAMGPAEVDAGAPYAGGQSGDDPAGAYARYQRSYRPYQRGSGDYLSSGVAGLMPRAVDLAYALGVRFDSPDESQYYSPGYLRLFYERHGMFSDAARVIEREISESPHERYRIELGMHRARLLERAGQHDAARKAAGEVEKDLIATLQASPTLLEPRAWLVALYRSPAYGADGADHAKAIAALTPLRLAYPAYDRFRRAEVHSLYKLGKFREAWGAYQAGQRAGTSPNAVPGGPAVVADMGGGEPTMYYAGLSAMQCGENEAGRALLRRALFKYPASPLAAKAREAIQ
jgi:tetratricopeptide (TPR) repeat protein